MANAATSTTATKHEMRTWGDDKHIPNNFLNKLVNNIVVVVMVYTDLSNIIVVKLSVPIIAAVLFSMSYVFNIVFKHNKLNNIAVTNVSQRTRRDPPKCPETPLYFNPLFVGSKSQLKYSTFSATKRTFQDHNHQVNTIIDLGVDEGEMENNIERARKVEVVQ